MFQKKTVEKIGTYVLCAKFFFSKCTVYEIIWKNTVHPDRPQMKIWRMRVSCWIIKCTDTN